MASCFGSGKKTKMDWVCEMRAVLEEDFPNAKKIILVCNNLNTHSQGTFYETFERSPARSLTRRLEFVHTSKHGSWLNVAKDKLSASTR
ncbi:MAG: transposase [Planctomycetaceae bacterium]|nr:transposase [Planctomycetaceae bacterium]